MSAAGRMVGARLAILAPSSTSLFGPLTLRFGEAYPLLSGVEVDLVPGVENVPREPSGNETVWISRGVIAVVGCACKLGWSAGELDVGRGGNGGACSD